MANNEILTCAALQKAVAGSAPAFRLTLKLEAVSPKVFPPTYEGGKYATEDRIIGGQKLPCVLLDSVPSQANRMELALQDAWSGGELELPIVSVKGHAASAVFSRRSSTAIWFNLGTLAKIRFPSCSTTKP